MSVSWWVAVCVLAPVGFLATIVLMVALCRSAARGDEAEAEMIAGCRTEVCSGLVERSGSRLPPLAEEFDRHMRARGAGCAR